MKNDKRIDDLFRKGLAEVDLPPAPGLDWAAMANSARHGARATAVQDRRAALRVRWMKLLGGASAILAAWYLAPGPAPRGDERVDAALAPEMRPTNARLLGGTPGALFDQLREGNAYGSVDQNATPTMVPEASEETIGTGHMLSKEPPVSKPSHGDTQDGDALVAMTAHMWVSTPSDTGIAPEGLPETDGRARVTPTTYDLTESPAPATSPAEGGAIPTSDASARITIDLLPSLHAPPAALSYRPVAAPQHDADYGRNFGRWTIAPWVAVGSSVWSDPDHGDRKAFPGLEVDSRMSRTAGLRVRFDLAERLALVGGLQFAHKGALRGTVHSSSTLTTVYDLSGDYLEVPLSLELNKPWGPCEVYARSGILLRLNTRTGSDRVAMTDALAKEMSTLVLAQGSVGTALDIGVGVRFVISERISLAVEPSYQSGLSSVIRHPTFDKLPFNPRIHTFNVGCGLHYQFR